MEKMKVWKGGCPSDVDKEFAKGQNGAGRCGEKNRLLADADCISGIMPIVYIHTDWCVHVSAHV